MIPETSGDNSAIRRCFELRSCRFDHFTPLRSTSRILRFESGAVNKFLRIFWRGAEGAFALWVARSGAADQNPRELHIAQWSQGLPLGSTEHCFSFSKNSTSSETAASSTPKRSWLGWSAGCAFSCVVARENGASHGDCATCEIKFEGRFTLADCGSACPPMEGWIRAGAASDTKLIRRARGCSSFTPPIIDDEGACGAVL